MEFNEKQKATIWTKLATALGIDVKEEEKEKEKEKLADSPVTEEPETPEEEKSEDDALAQLTAQVAELQKQVDELMKANGTAVDEKDKAVADNTQLKAQLEGIKNKPADKKVALASQTANNSPAAQAWQRYATK